MLIFQSSSRRFELVMAFAAAVVRALVLSVFVISIINAEETLSFHLIPHCSPVTQSLLHIGSRLPASLCSWVTTMMLSWRALVFRWTQF